LSSTGMTLQRLCTSSQHVSKYFLYKAKRSLLIGLQLRLAWSACQCLLYRSWHIQLEKYVDLWVML